MCVQCLLLLLIALYYSGYRQFSPKLVSLRYVTQELDVGDHQQYSCAFETPVDSASTLEWVNSSRHSLPALNTSCSTADLKCMCSNRSSEGVHSFRLPFGYQQRANGLVRLLNISLIVCSATAKLSDQYTCVYNKTLNGTSVQLTVVDTTIPPSSVEGTLGVPLIVTLSVIPVFLLLVIIVLMLVCIRVCRHCGREKVSTTAFPKLTIPFTVDMKSLAQYDCLDQYDSMEFTRDNLEFLSLLGK